jgi:hypothetical protein
VLCTTSTHTRRRVRGVSHNQLCGPVTVLSGLTLLCTTASDCTMTCGNADHPLEAYYRTLLESLKDLVKELRLEQMRGNSLFAISRIGSQVRALKPR